MSDVQDDIDSAAEAQQQSEEQQQCENSGVMDPRCFTLPMPVFPQITPEHRQRMHDYNQRVMDLILGTLEHK